MRFVLGAWALTRLLILSAFAIARPQNGMLEALGNWDGGWYKAIVASGYEFAADGKAHSVAFFPLFPLLSSALTHVGLSWPLAGVLLNNVAFLVAVLLLYRYVRETFDTATARWSAVVACAFPLSLFCSVAYAEGLFILFSVIALASYRRKQYLAAGIAAALASATRPLGFALAVALIVAAVFERRRSGAVLQCATGLLGTGAYMLYCAVRFGDPLAFVHAVQMWRHHIGLDVPAWIAVPVTAYQGSPHSWLLMFLVLVGVPCVAIFRERIGVAGVAYVALCLAAIALAGTPFSVDRYLYASVPLLVALARLFTRLPVVGYLVAGASLPLLFTDAVTFAQFHWVA